MNWKIRKIKYKNKKVLGLIVLNKKILKLIL